MDPTVPADRIAVSLICFFVLLAVLAVAFWIGTVRGKRREEREAKIREADRAFQTEQIGRLVTAIVGENRLRIEAEEARLYARTTRASE